MLSEIVDLAWQYSWIWIDVGGIGVLGVSLYHIWTSAGYAVGRTPGNKSAKEYAKDRPSQLAMGYAVSVFWPIVLGVLSFMLVGTAGIALIQAPHRVLKTRERARFANTPAGLTEMLYEQLATLQEQRETYGDDPAFAGSAYLADQFIGDVEQQIEELKPSVIRQQKADEIPVWAWEQSQKRIEETARRQKIRDKSIDKNYPEDDAGPKALTTSSYVRRMEENQASENAMWTDIMQTESTHDDTSVVTKSLSSKAHSDQWAKAKPRFLYSCHVRKDDGETYVETVRETPEQELARVQEEFDKYRHPSWMLTDYLQKIEHTQVGTELINVLYQEPFVV